MASGHGEKRPGRGGILHMGDDHANQLTLELAPLAITANAICAGVTETPAVAKIPGREEMVEVSRRRNPRGRLTAPEDVASVLVALSGRGCGWVSGNVIRVDGGEGIV